MPVSIDIIFAGLIAFVPNTTGHPSTMTAYLVNDANHKPRLSIFGKNLELVPKNVDGDPFHCKRFLIEEPDGYVVRCDLADTDVQFATNVRQQRLRRGRPRREVPGSTNERESLEWLVQLDSVERSTGRIRPWDNIKDNIGASITFGWEDARACEYDGDELGRLATIAFRPEATEEPLRQAVAESLLFSANVAPGPMTIRLRNRQSGAKRMIRASCATTHCLALSVENSRREHTCRAHYDGNHFLRYYGLVREPGEMRAPFRYDDRDRRCPTSKSEEPLGRLLLACWLRQLRPAAPRLEEILRERLNPPPASEVNRKTLAGWLLDPGLLPMNQPMATTKATGRDVEKFLDILFGLFEVQDRIICPPVVLEH